VPHATAPGRAREWGPVSIPRQLAPELGLDVLDLDAHRARRCARGRRGDRHRGDESRARGGPPGPRRSPSPLGSTWWRLLAASPTRGRARRRGGAGRRRRDRRARGGRRAIIRHLFGTVADRRRGHRPPAPRWACVVRLDAVGSTLASSSAVALAVLLAVASGLDVAVRAGSVADRRRGGGHAPPLSRPRKDCAFGSGFARDPFARARAAL